MRIGLNLLYLLPGVVGGTETYAAGLLNGLAGLETKDEYIVFLNQESANWSLPQSSNFSKVVCPVLANSRLKRYWFEQIQFPKLVKQHGVDLLHSLGYVAPLVISCPSVVTIHDLNYSAFGNKMPFAKRVALEFFVKQSARRSNYIVAPSRFAQQQIIKSTGISPNKITIINEAPQALIDSRAEWAKVSQEYGIQKPYIIAFSSTSPNKNLGRLVEAFAQARQAHQLPHHLVLLGHQSSELYNIKSQNIFIWTGYVQEPVKQTLLANAEMLVFPSTYEGFGIPILEGMQVGVPVVCSNTTSLPEVAGDAAVFFNPFSINEIADKISQVATDDILRQNLKSRGFENVKRFSWEKAAKETLQVYRDILK